jgi:hypothetical protein
MQQRHHAPTGADVHLRVEPVARDHAEQRSVAQENAVEHASAPVSDLFDPR